MKRIALSLGIALVAICSLSSLVSAQQQGLPVDGRDFYIGLVMPSFYSDPPQLADGDFHGFSGWYVLISSYTDNTATISYFDDAGNETISTPYHIAAQQGRAIVLSRSAMQLKDSAGDVPEFKACHITAKRPINVQYLSTGACSGGSYLSIPTPALGKSYVIPSYNDNPGNGAGQAYQAENAGGFFLIISAFDNTTVTITPNGRTAGGHSGVNSGRGAVGTPNAKLVTYSVTLRRGQVYWVKGDGSDDANDLSGSTVTSNKPVGVLAGHEDAFLGEAPSGGLLDGRDYMVEQVIPSEYWDSTGYVTIPLIGANPVDETATGYGDVYRTYTNSPKGANIEENDGIVAKNDMSTSLYASPPQTRGIGTPMEMHSNNGDKFSVMCYEQRDQGTAEPYPAESMMSIVPMSRWRTSYLFYVPANALSESLQDYYINLIGEKKDVELNIVFSHNGGPLSKLSNFGSSKGKFIGTIPNHPELEGVRYRVQPGSYYFTNPRTTVDPNVDIDTMLRGAFMIYHYGMRSIDPDFDLGDFCGDDFFFSYALPVGMTVSSGGGHPVVTVDTLCSSWHVCVHDSVAIASATLIDDPNGDVYGRPGKVFKNVNFDATSDPFQTGEIVFQVTGNLATDTMRCFDVIVANPFDTAYAPLYIVDKNGFHLSPILELHYKAPSVSELLQVPQPPKKSTYIKVDTLQFGMLRVGGDSCQTLALINTSPKGAKSFYISTAEMQKGFSFKKVTTTPSLADTLHGGDTLLVQVCFNPTDTTGFNGGDSAVYNDSVIITTDCFKAPLLVLAKVGTPLIFATDWDFGPVTVGTQACHDITIYNKGALPFTLTKQWILHNTTVFSMSPSSAAILPYTLQPGAHIALTFCYSPSAVGPQDSTTVDWNTDIESPFTSSIKSWSYLKGKPIKPGLVWDRQTQLDSVICEDSIVVRVRLINRSTAKARSVNVLFDGPDAAEYKIVGDSLGYLPLTNFDMDTGQVVWVDVLFKADLTKPLAVRYAPRHANLVANYEGGTTVVDSTVIKFTGLVQHAVLVFKPQMLNIGFITKGIGESGNVIVIDTGDAPFVFKSSDFPNPPIDSVSMNGRVLLPGDTIGRGDTVILHINVHLDSYIDTTVTYTLFSDHSCGDFPATLQVAASQLNVLATTYPAPDVFVGCREHDSTVIFLNKGSVLITLDSVDISGLNPVGQFDLIDSKGNRGTSLTIGKKLNHLESDTIGIVYHPTVLGPASGTIRFIFDSAGVKKVITTQATGNGVQLQTALSAAQAGGLPYTGTTEGNISVPISLTTKALPANADARRVTFRVSYLQDVVNFISVAPNNGNIWTPAPIGTGNPPVPVDPGANNEYIDFDISNPQLITNLQDIVTILYQPMVAEQLATKFTISGVQFYDSKNVPICYIAADTIPGAFIPQYLCGDSTLRIYLLGKFPTRIAKLSPSILNEDQTPILYYSINRSDLPVKVELFNVLGDRIRTLQNKSSQLAGDYRLPIGTLGLPSGSYIVRLTTPISSESANFILQK